MNGIWFFDDWMECLAGLIAGFDQYPGRKVSTQNPVKKRLQRGTRQGPLSLR
jgi:hypothetical protein